MRLVIAFLLSGCVSYGPRAWRPDQHMDMMAECRSACGDRMTAYEPYNGRCECAPKIIRSYP